MSEFKVRRRSNYVQRTCRIEEDLLDKIEETVFKCNLFSANGLINDCLRFALENMEIETDSKRST